MGKAAIVRTILHAERHSKLYVDPSNIYNKLNVVNIRETWFVKFMQVLGPGRKAPHVESVLDDVSFINFNYDRCLEHFLRNALQLLYSVPQQKAAEIVSKANIIHPYGFVGTLEKVPYGGNIHGRMDFRELSNSIKTYTERIEEPEVLQNMQAAIREADCVVFLGFAYHKQNMALLKPPRSQKTKQIYGTAFQMSDKDVEEVVDELGTFFPDHENNQSIAMVGEISMPIVDMHDNIRIENKLTCAQLFDHYAKSLAG